MVLRKQTDPLKISMKGKVGSFRATSTVCSRLPRQTGPRGRLEGRGPLVDSIPLATLKGKPCPRQGWHFLEIIRKLKHAFGSGEDSFCHSLELLAEKPWLKRSSHMPTSRIKSLGFLHQPTLQVRGVIAGRRHPCDSQGLFALAKDQRPLNAFIYFSGSGDDVPK